MTDPTQSLPPEPARTSSAVPGDGGDVVPGDPPVPITVWHLPRPTRHDPVPAAFTRRLAANFTCPGGTVIDLTTQPGLSHARPGSAGLVISVWPLTPAVSPARHLAGCVPCLAPGGCIALVITATRTPGHLGDLVTAARTAGLAYLQHIVVAHNLAIPAAGTVRPASNAPAAGPAPSAGPAPVAGPAPGPGTGRAGRARPSRHLKVHTDVLVFRLPAGR